MKKFITLSLILVAVASTFVFAASLPALAVTTGSGGPDVWGTQTGNPEGAGVISDATGLGERDPRDIAAQVINIILGFLGIVAVVIILLGGFKWMTAGGNEDKVGEARKLITAGIIGLIIILASFAIASFVLTQLSAAVAQ